MPLTARVSATQFILDPLYKIYSQVLGEPESTVRAMLSEFGVYLKPSAYRQDVKPLLKDACSSIFGSATGLTDMMVRHFPSARAASASKVWLHTELTRCNCNNYPERSLPFVPHRSATARVDVGGSTLSKNVNTRALSSEALLRRWSQRSLSYLWSTQGKAASMHHAHRPHLGLAPRQVERLYTGPQTDSELVEHMKACNAKGPLVVHIAKLFPKSDCSAFDAFGRVFSGTVRPGDKVRWQCPVGARNASHAALSASLRPLLQALYTQVLTLAASTAAYVSTSWG